MRKQHSQVHESPCDNRNSPTNQRGSVIWITGFSGSGKTTVARLVDRKLKEVGLNTVFLDGDDLRSIFSNRWGYDREERIALARIYFRLSSHLASQGVTVIIAAVAMYNDIYNWVRTNIPRSIQVYLDVPEDERRRRDAKTKNIYQDMGNLSELYDIPTEPDLVCRNDSSRSAEESANDVVSYFESLGSTGNEDYGRSNHWESFYERQKGVFEPSPFARDVAKEIKPSCKILEVGCGNGRDAAYFADNGWGVVAIDVSASAIAHCRQYHGRLPIQFINSDASALVPEYSESFDVVYCRFALHSMTEFEEIEMLRASKDLLARLGNLYIECRSINDPLASLGEVLSPTERIYGHYRRFIVKDGLVSRVSRAGLVVEQTIEASGLAVFRNEDPVVLRLRARKP